MIAGNEAALDDITLSTEPCPSNILDCDFEEDFCGWSNVSPVLDTWLIGRGFTVNSSLVSGPFSDHTTRNGMYAYIDFTDSSPCKFSFSQYFCSYIESYSNLGLEESPLLPFLMSVCVTVW